MISNLPNKPSRYYCSRCYQIFNDSNHRPRIIEKCYHSYCEVCIKKLIDSNKQTFVCPEDNSLIQNVTNIEVFPVNFEILRQIRSGKELSPKQLDFHKTSTQTQDQNESVRYSDKTLSQQIMNNTYRFQSEEPASSTKDLCRRHQLQLEFFCQNHQSQICLQCISSKDHQNHKIIDIDEHLRELHDVKQRISLLHQQVKDKHLIFESEQQNCLKDVREVNLLIEQKFQDLIQRLKNLEDLAIRQVGILVLKIDDYFTDKLGESSKEVQFQITEFHRRLDKIMMDEHQLILSSEKEIRTFGSNIIEQIQTHLIQDRKVISSIIAENIKVNFNSETLKLDKICVVPLELNLKVFDNIKKLDLKKSPLKSEFSINLSSIIQQPEQEPLSPQFRQQTFGQAHAPLTSRNERSKSFQFVQIGAKRSKSNDSRVFQRIRLLLSKGDNQEKIDLSNQNLNDWDLIQFCEWFENSNSKVEILKLTKNKITDTGFEILFNVLSKKESLHTLNLTSNYCTEKSIEIIEKAGIKQKVHLVNIYFTSCRFSPNFIKNRPKQFTIYGINIFL